MTCWIVLLAFWPSGMLAQSEPTRWALARATKLPSELTNQESTYFSLVAGRNGKLYIGAAKYGENAYLLEYDPAQDKCTVVVDAMKTIGSNAKGFAAQAKFHTRGNVGESGKIYHGTKQGYPEAGESRDAYPGGYVIVYDPQTRTTEHFGIAKPRHGIISVMPDEPRGLIYISTCSDDRPIDHTHFMVLDVKSRKYKDLGDMEHMYAFIVLDHRGRALHPIRGGKIARYDPEAQRLERLHVTLDGKELPVTLQRDGTIWNWETSPDRRTLYGIELATNQLVEWDLTASGDTLPARSLGALLPWAKATDCRAMCVDPQGVVWATVTVHQGIPEGPACFLVSCRPGEVPTEHGRIGVANPDFTTFVDAQGKPKPWHHTMPKTSAGILSPWQPMGICATKESVYVVTIAPFTLLRFDRNKLLRNGE
jgi:sugar lactone lactonase YvrE